MKRSKRSCYQRLDYRVLNSSGKKVVVNASSSDSETDQGTDSDSQNGGNHLNHNLDPVLISSFESLAIQSTSVVSKEEQYSQHYFPLKISIPSGGEISVTSPSASILETSTTSLSEFATPQVNSTLAFDYSHIDSSVLHITEPSRNQSSNVSITVTDDYILSIFSQISRYVRGLTKLIKPAVGRNFSQKSFIMSVDSPNSNVELTQKALGADIDDFIEEYSASDCETVEEVNNCVSRAEDLRSVYRLKHSEYSKICEDYENSEQKTDYEMRIASVKRYLKKLKDRKKFLKDEDTMRESEVQEKTSKFLIKEIHKNLSELSIELDYITEFNDEQITTKKAAIPQVEKKLVGVANSIKDLLAHKDSSIKTEVDKITTAYDGLCNMKRNYVHFIIKEAESRELSKKELFNAAKLNIHLGKFSGYDSKSDIFTFQSEFADLNQLTPKRYHARKLKNNHLEGAALALVKNVDDIDDIWYRLKAAYGDPKLMLKKKLK